jgi:ribose-phosphate pyrophosphokinase
MIICDGVEFMKFPAGETFFKYTGPKENDIIKIEWQYEDDSEIFQIANLLHYFDSKVKFNCIELNIPYFPHARQDRFTNDQQPFSLEVVVKMLSNILAPYRHKINAIDPHSNAFEKLCKEQNLNLEIKKQWEYAVKFKNKYKYVIAPDKGAVEKAAKWAAELEIPMIPCSKDRDPATGKLSMPKVPDIDLGNALCLLVDDIGDGFRTHINLCKKLKEKSNSVKVDIFVSHAIFSSGIDNLLENFENIYTTKSLPYYLRYIHKSNGRLIALDI